MKDEIIKILISEDVESDYLMAEHYLKNADFKYKTKFVDNKKQYVEEIKNFTPDIILADYNIPGFSGIEALEIKKNICPETPFILVTGFLSEKDAVLMIKKGAWDYVLKDNYSRLLPAVESALKYKKEKNKVLEFSEKLKQSNQKFETIFNNVTEPIFIFDYQKNTLPIIEFANKSAKNLIKHNIIGKPITILVPHIPDNEIFEKFKQIKQGQTLKELITFKNKNEKFYFQITLNRINFENTKKVLVSANDITEKHIALLKLKDKNILFKKLYEDYLNQNTKLQDTISYFKKSKKELANKINIINRSPAVVFLWENKDGWPVKFVSENVKKLTGYSASDFENKTIFYEQIIHPEDLQRVRNEVKKSVNDPEKNKTDHLPYRIITKNNEIKWVSDDTIIIRKEGEAVSFEGIIYDVSDRIVAQEELRNSEEKYRSILENNPNSVLIISKDKKIKYLNTKAKKTFNNARENDICHKVLFSSENPCSWCGQKFAGDYENFQDEIIIPRQNKNFLYTCSKLSNNNGQSDFLSIFSDISELKKLKREQKYFADVIDKELNEVYFIKADDFKVLYANNEAKLNLDYKNEIIFDKKIYEFQKDKTKKAYQRYAKKLINGKEKQISFETEHITSAGNSYPVSVTLKLSNYKDQRVIIAIAKNIREQKEKEELIKLLSTAVHQSPVSIVITDYAGNIEYMNPWFTKITGYSKDEVIGKNPRILKSGSQTDEFYKNLWQTVTSGKVWEGEFENKKKNGKFFWEKAIISPVIGQSGEITNFIAVKEDITEKKEIREKLQKSEEHFRLLFENSLIGMYLMNKEGEIVNANKAFLNILGYKSLSEIQGKKLDNFKDISINRDKFHTLMSKKTFLSGFESVWYDKNKNLIYVRENTRKYTDEYGNKFYEGTVEDITKEKTALRQLRELNDFNEKLIKEGNLGYAVFDSNGQCIKANEEYARIAGAKTDDILKKNFYKNKKWEKYNLIETAKNCIRHGIHKKQIIIDKSSYGKDIYAEMSFNRLYFGTKAHLLVILKDISSFIKAKRRQMQTKSEYINLIESINVPVFGIDTRGNIKIWNKVMEELSGYERSEIRRKNISYIIPDTDRSFIPNLVENAFSKHDLSNKEILITTKNGNIKRLNISCTIQTDNTEKITGFTCIAQDITEREKQKKELEKQIEERTHDLIEALKKEKELGELKSKFVSMTSHEFRTPLSTIKMATGYIRRYYDKAEKEKILQKTNKIDMQADHMTALLEDILTIGKIENGKIKFNPKNLNLINVLKTIIEDVENATKNTHKIIFKTDVSEYKIYSDSKILNNIFINLLNNAIKFSPDSNQVFLTLKSYPDRVLLKVKDKGIGISENELKNIFTPFRRAENADTIQGTGLGLAIVKQSVDLLKGKIKVESKLGKGTEFTVMLPKKLANEKL